MRRRSLWEIKRMLFRALARQDHWRVGFTADELHEYAAYRRFLAGDSLAEVDRWHARGFSAEVAVRNQAKKGRR